MNAIQPDTKVHRRPRPVGKYICAAMAQIFARTVQRSNPNDILAPGGAAPYRGKAAGTPPSTVITVPVDLRLRSDASHQVASATSSGSIVTRRRFRFR